MAEFASKGTAGAGLGLGIAGTALGLLNGGLGNIFGNGCYNNGNGCDHLVSRYEMEMENKIVNKDSEIALLKSNIYTDQKISDVYERLSTKINGVESAVNTQAVVNATMTSTIGCMQNQIAQLQGLTKVVIPNSNICPGWGDVTITTTPTTTTTP